MLTKSHPVFRCGLPVLLTGILLSSTGRAQTASGGLPGLPTDKLALPANWQRAGGVMASPSEASLKAVAGTTVLVGKAGDALTLVANPTDFALQTELLLSAGATAQLTLPSGQTIPLVEPQLSKMPGLWQTMSLRYRAATIARPASIDLLAINGVTVREGQTLSRSNTKGPLLLTVTNGTVALRNIGYRALANRTIARWAGPLTYAVYDGETIDRANLPKLKVLKKDTTSAISYESSYGTKPRGFTMLFQGKLNIPEAATYQFDLDYGGRADLRIDGKEVAKADYKDLGAYVTAQVPLTAGTHDIEVLYARAWQRPGLGLFISLPDTRPQALHTLVSLPEPDPIGTIAIQPNGRPELIRSFVQLPGEKLKRTHSLSVGTPAGKHFTLDLNQMALLQVWKGPFADVTEMWYERGEPQLLKPMGVNVRLSPQTALMPLSDPQAAWPDSVSETILQYRGTVIDKQGMPTIEYGLSGATVTDAVRASTDGLTRTLTLSGTTQNPVVCRLAAGSRIEEVEKGLYAVNDRAYYIRIDPKLKPQLSTINGQQELRLPVKGAVSYEIVF
ncbi:hypothetical protein [Rudanella lutea]|uniref:hypothetical protein n=1 Tax=Rudanella lutea TaxID=451374 RepID=UPI0003702D28|nr:hypothetical protein [Rudanella lutea]